MECIPPASSFEEVGNISCSVVLYKDKEELIVHCSTTKGTSILLSVSDYADGQDHDLFKPFQMPNVVNI